jgi:SAM-dependent methyltransferase
MKLVFSIAFLYAFLGFSMVTFGQAPAPTAGSGVNAPAASTNLQVVSSPTAITVQVVQPPKQSTAIETYAPYAVAGLALLGVIATAIYTLYQGRMDARYTYATEILKLRFRQVEEFYAPALLYIEQSRAVYEKLLWTIEHERKDVPLSGFRLLDRIYEFNHDPQFRPLKPLIERILAIGKELTGLISKKSGLIEGGISPTFIEYQAHFDILNAASEQKLSAAQMEGWHKFGYYPRMLNREIREGYKVVLAQLENYENAGDQIIRRLLNQKAVELGKHRRQLVENLQFYEDHARNYAVKFDAFDLSQVRQRFIDEIESTRKAQPQSFENDNIHILDAGCGTGRDTYEFLKKGYVVTAIDASPAMLRECRRKLRDALDKPANEEMKQAAAASRWLEVTFDEIRFRNEFDGVWAAASLLHVPSVQMEEILRKIFQALKANGILFMSFKYGHGEHERDARFYSHYGRKDIRALLGRISSAEVIDVWLSDAGGKNVSRGQQGWAWGLELINRYDRSRWLNILVRKTLK